MGADDTDFEKEWVCSFSDLDTPLEGNTVWVGHRLLYLQIRELKEKDPLVLEYYKKRHIWNSRHGLLWDDRTVIIKKKNRF